MCARTHTASVTPSERLCTRNCQIAKLKVVIQQLTFALATFCQVGLRHGSLGGVFFLQGGKSSSHYFTSSLIFARFLTFPRMLIIAHFLHIFFQMKFQISSLVLLPIPALSPPGNRPPGPPIPPQPGPQPSYSSLVRPLQLHLLPGRLRWPISGGTASRGERRGERWLPYLVAHCPFTRCGVLFLHFEKKMVVKHLLDTVFSWGLGF